MTRTRTAPIRAGLTLALLALVYPSASLAQAPPPRLVPFQGQLTDGAGQPITGVERVTFAIYDVPTGGNPLWDEMHPSVSIVAGQINVLLGALTSLDDPGDSKPPVCFAAVPTDCGPKYLGIKIGADSNQEMIPRHQLVPAFHARSADIASATTDGAIKTNMIAPDAVNSSKIANATITGADVATNTITSANIANGTVAVDDLAAGAVAGANLAANSVTTGAIVNATIKREDLAAEVGNALVPVGAFVLFGGASCPAGYTDRSAEFSNRVLRVAQPLSIPTLGGGDGSHPHGGGAHTHNPPNVGGEATNQQDFADPNWTDNFSEDPASVHSHTGGSHDHWFVGLRLCQKQ